MKTGVAYFSTRDPRHVKQDLKDMVDHNCNLVVHTYSETDYNYYSIIMRDIIRMSHDMGLEVYINPWGVGRVFGGPEAYSQFVSENPGECQRMADGSFGPAVCLNSQVFRDYMRSWVDSAVDTGAKTIFWDEPHFHYPLSVVLGTQKEDEWACVCDRCRGLFKERFNRDIPKVMDDDVIKFRDDVILEFFKELVSYAKGKGLKNAVCVLPDEDPLFGVSSWEKVVELDEIDIFGTDPYWMLWQKPLDEYVRGLTRKVLDMCSRNKKEAQMWVQSFMILEGREEEVGKAAEIMAEEGVKNIAAWSYLGGAFMNHKSQNHEKVWEVLGEVYGKIRGR